MTGHAPRAARARTSEEMVILVDADDRALGAAPKLAAHQSGALHRAVSVLLTDGDDRVLLQQRALAKYHSAGLWANSACGHPRPGERAVDAAVRRLAAELGVYCALDAVGRFAYRAELANGLVEHEVDHVFVGRFVGTPAPDPAEVAAWQWLTLSAVRGELASHPERFAPWLEGVLQVAQEHPLLAADRGVSAVRAPIPRSSYRGTGGR
jgi:isopentenyl-diphosphate delta-isomerase